MNISKVLGIVESMRNGQDARIKVVSFKRGGVNVTQSAEIKSQFSPSGYVFAPSFFEKNPFEDLSAIEFSAVELPFVTVENGDHFRLDWNKDCRLIPSRLYQAPEQFLVSEYSINQPVLKQFVSDTATNIYFKSGEKIYGPFKYANGEIVPKTGTLVDVYQSADVFLVASAGVICVGFIDGAVIGKCDCMTLSQLAEWLRTHLKSTLTSVDLNAWRKVIESVQSDNIDAARADRSLRILDQLNLTAEELKLLASATDYKVQFNAAIARVERDIVTTIVQPYQEQIDSSKLQIGQLDKQKQLLFTEIEAASRKLSELTKSYEYLIDQKQRLIEDLRVQTEVKMVASGTASFVTFERQEYDYKESAACTLKDFGDRLSKTLYLKDAEDLFIAHRVIDQLKVRRAILADNVEVIQCIARATGNTSVFIQQVEADWLKFDFFYRNGLSDIFKAAHAEPARIFFMLLQDINLASVECYARPVKDLLSGVRRFLPGTEMSWPKNLWLFALPVDIEESPELGLPLNPGWFRQWGSLPKKLSIQQADRIEITGKLSPEAIFSDPTRPLFIPNDFFDA